MKKPYTIALYTLIGILVFAGLSIMAYMFYELWFIDRNATIAICSGISLIILMAFLSYKANQE